jgi:hypothetical protein
VDSTDIVDAEIHRDPEGNGLPSRARSRRQVVEDLLGESTPIEIAGAEEEKGFHSIWEYLVTSELRADRVFWE